MQLVGFKTQINVRNIDSYFLGRISIETCNAFGERAGVKKRDLIYSGPVFLSKRSAQQIFEKVGKLIARF